MRRLIYYLPIILIISISCTKEDTSVLAAFDVYCEMVANDAKPVAFHYPMKATAIDQWWNEFQKIAEKHQVELYREAAFPTTMLFPTTSTKDKTVVIIYRGDRLEQYQQWKADLGAYEGNDSAMLVAFARRLGRLLGYSPQGINQLLSKNSDYRNLTSFQVNQQITHLYYDELEKALEFYEKTIGLIKTDTTQFQISADAFIELHSLNESHPKGQAKSTAIAFLTDQLPAWYDYLQKENVPIKYTYKPKEGGPHDGFVAIDPEGYLLEFEHFKQHPENELFMAALSKAPRLETSVKSLNFYGSITWTYHQDLLKMQQFYEEVLGYQLVADQGWTKIYQTSSSGFIGLVDERRGMENYADTKAVELEWNLIDSSNFHAYAEQFWQQYQYENNLFIGPEKYRYLISSK